VPQVVYPSSTYGQLAYRFNEHAQVSGYYSVSYANRKDKEGLRWSSGAGPPPTPTRRTSRSRCAWTSTRTCCSRANTIASTAPPTSPSSTTRSRSMPNWNLFAVKATFHF
jgi:hypothetical protein